MDIRWIALLGAAAFLLPPSAATGASESVTIPGNAATLRWQAATGPVAGYYVIVARNGGDPEVAGVSEDLEEVVSGEYGETLTVQVAAFDADGVAGPVSAASEPFTFVAPDDGGTGGGTGGGGGGGGGGSEVPPADGGGGAGEVVLAPFDLTGDGRSDFLVREGGSVELWAMQGAQVASVHGLPPVPADARLAASGDYDGNGATDLLWESGGARWIWLFDGGAVVASGDLDVSALEADAQWRVAGTADFDADGRDDLLLASGVLGVAEIWSMDGTAVAARTRIAGRLGAWTVSALLDFDADGIPEILWRDEVNHRFELDDLDATAPATVADSVRGWRVVAAGNLYDDYRREVLVRDLATGDVELWSFDGAEAAVGRRISASPQVELSDFGDYDGDGLDDWVWVVPATGQVAVRLSSDKGRSLAPDLVDRAFPPGAELVSGMRAPEKSACAPETSCP